MGNICYRIYSWRTLRPLVILTEHKKPISDIQFSPTIVRYWKSKIFASGKLDYFKLISYFVFYM